MVRTRRDARERALSLCYELDVRGSSVDDLLVELPVAPAPYAVELSVAQTDPGVQGDRVSGAKKPATLETGAVVQVPLFVETGDRIKVDTRSGEYLTRV